MAAIAERPPDYEEAARGAPAPRLLPLPPGSVPVDPVRSTISAYRAGVASDDRLIAAIDRHSDALQREIARKAVENLADFQRTVNRLEVLAGYISTRIAQLDWLERFPYGPASEAVPLTCPVGRGHAAVPRLLDALRGVELDARVLAVGATARSRRDGRRGAAASMAALADCGVSATDVALELGIAPSRAWAVLNGKQLAPPELRRALVRLVGIDQMVVVIDGIPVHPRARAPASAALRALHDAGATADDVAPLIPATPSTVCMWLRGAGRAPAKLIDALEQLLGADPAATVIAAIPKRARIRAPTSPALTALHDAGASAEDLYQLIDTNPATVRKWLRGALPAPPQLAAALEQLVDVDQAARIVSLIQQPD